MNKDNLNHKTLFTIPEPTYSTAIAVTKPLPLQRIITGHKQTDAYLWVLDVIKLNDPAHLQAAEDALKKLTITPKQAEECYSNYMAKSGAHPMQMVFGTMGMDNPQGYFHAAKKAIKEAAKVRAVFGNYEKALENTEAENLMLVGELADVYAPFWGWTKKEIAKKCIEGRRCNEIDNQRKAISKGFAAQLPEPHTLSDVVREFEYWSWLYWVRVRAGKELGYQYGDGDRDYIFDREDYIESLLPTIKAVSRQEAIDVCQWVLSSERLNDRGEITNSIILNLVGECEQ